MSRSHTVIDSPVGSLTLVATDGALSGLYMEAQRHRPLEAYFGARDRCVLPAVTEQLGDDQVMRFDTHRSTRFGIDAVEAHDPVLPAGR